MMLEHHHRITLLAAARLTLGATLATMTAPAARAQLGEVAPAELRVEAQTDPVGFDAHAPSAPRVSPPGEG